MFDILNTVANPPHNWIETVNAVSTGVIAIFAIVTAIAVILQIRIARNSERAWVLVDIGKVDQLQKDSLGVWIVPAAKNYGKTPARIIKLALRQHQVKSPDGLPPKPEYTGEQVLDFILPPNETVQPMAVGVTSQDFNAVRDLKIFLYVYGYIEYIDLGEKRRQTRFCLMYYVPLGGSPLQEGFAMGIQAPAAYTKCT